ncbi:MAG: hypothetical protein BWY82_01223 [Verrucomicrobia bacterium ADurb.Bin474]|nr:MAG: hypothetical protein BWY82_01223 [Verrucomicrobia bacterium ADurb.Bin474]
MNLSFLLDIEDPTQRANAIEYELARTRRELGQSTRYKLSQSGRRLSVDNCPLEGLIGAKLCAKANSATVDRKELRGLSEAERFDLRVSRGVDCLFTGWKHPQDTEHGFPPWALLRDEQTRDWHSFRTQPPTCTPEGIQGGFVQLGQLLDAVAVSDLRTQPGGDPYLRLKLIHDWIERITAGSWMPFGEFLASQDSGLKSAIPWAVEHPQAPLIGIPSNSKRGDFLGALDELAKAIPPERFIDGKPGQDPTEKGIIQALIVKRLEMTFGRKENVLAFQCLEVQGLASWEHRFSTDPDGTPTQVRAAAKAVSKHRTRMDDLLKAGQYKGGQDITEPFRTSQRK